MAYIADLHIHSRFARACSPALNVPNLVEWAKMKGIDVLGTGDFLHPLWFSELKMNLTEDGSGFLTHKNSDIKFILTVEIATMYSDKGKGRRLHNLIFLPDFASAEAFQKLLLSRRANLASDGRPILGMSSKDLLSLALQVSEKAIFIPAHAWTPWFGIFGSQSGYDSLKECFEDLTEYIYGVETGLSCYDEKTEVLTDKGWKKFTEVQYKDKICTLNLKNDNIKFEKPTKIYVFDYKGKMYKLKTKRVDLLVTPNHKLLVSGCDFRKPPRFVLKEAEFLINKSKRFKKDGLWVGTNLGHFILPDVKVKHGSRFYSGYRTKEDRKLPIEPWLRFFGFWIAEGWTSKGKNGDYNVCLSNKDNSIISKMKYILESFGYQVYWNRKTITLRVRDYQLYSYLKQFGGSADKFIPLEVKSLSKELLEIFFEYYIKGDGHKYGRNGKGLSATTISLRLRDDLQEIALKLGMSAYYRLHKKKGTAFKNPGSNYKKIYLQSADSWVVYFIRKNIHTVLPSTIKEFKYIEKWVDFKGKVFCVTVPNHVIYVRRNGIPVWCGNSDPAMNWRVKELDQRSIVSFSDAHSLPNLGRESTVIAQDINTGYGGLFEALKGQKIAGTIEFYPEEGKYHYTGHRNCNVKYSPEDTKAKGTICPICKRGLTVGVMERVEVLASRGNDKLQISNDKGMIKAAAFPGRPGYKMLVPLLQIIAEAFNTAPTSQKAINEYKKLVSSLGSEIKILTKIDISEIAKVSGDKIAEGVAKVRKGDLVIDPGYDGVYGVVKIWDHGKVKVQEKGTIAPQLGLFD